jgi:hypothetical protein
MKAILICEGKVKAIAETSQKKNLKAGWVILRNNYQAKGVSIGDVYKVGANGQQTFSKPSEQVEVPIVETIQSKPATVAFDAPKPKIQKTVKKPKQDL